MRCSRARYYPTRILHGLRHEYCSGRQRILQWVADRVAAKSSINKDLRERPGQMCSGRFRYGTIRATEPSRVRLVQTAGCPSEHTPGPLATTRDFECRNLLPQRKIRGAALLDTHRQALRAASHGQESCSAESSRRDIECCSVARVLWKAARALAAVLADQSADVVVTDRMLQDGGAGAEPALALARRRVALGRLITVVG